ncbi:MAG: ACP S-malonyltransferase [Lentisphaerae bacterium]|nr:ACP S-malonyltransferase [Lentisphaerota bacterium]
MTKRAVVFSGQGAQAAGMGRDLAAAYPECARLFARADEVLGYPLSRICFEGPEEDLTRSDRCQPAIFVTSMACLKALEVKLGGTGFAAAAGLSLGEWTALHAAGALSFEDTLRVLEARGRFMQEACQARAGGMVSVIGLPVERIDAICASAGVEKANVNSAEQIVLSGERAAVAAAEKLAVEAGAAKTVVLNVAGAFHSSLMAPAARRLDAFLASVAFRPPCMPVVANVTGRPHEAAEIRRTMVAQVTSPVRWLSCVEWFMHGGFRVYAECGPGRVVTGLIKRIDRSAALHNIQDCSSLERAAEALKA